MKMRDIVNIIEHHMDLNYETSVKNSENHFKIDSTFKNNLANILKIPCFKTNFSDLYSFFLENDILEFRKNETFNVSKFEKIKTLEKLCELYLENFKAFYPEIKETSISLKLQETNDLEKIANTMLSLNKALNLLFSGNNLDSSFQLSNFDQGSKWIDIILEKKDAFLCFAAVVTFVTTTVNSIQDARLKEAEIEKIKAETKMINEDLEEFENLKKYTKMHEEKILDLKIMLKVKELIANHYDSEDTPELPNRLKLAIKELIEINLNENNFRPTDLIAYNIPDDSLNPWGYIEYDEKKQIEYRNTANIENFENN